VSAQSALSAKWDPSLSYIPRRVPPRTGSHQCRGIFPEHLATSGYSVRLDSEIIQYKRDWDLINFLPYCEMEKVLDHLYELKHIKLHHPKLVDLQYLLRLQGSDSLQVDSRPWALGSASCLS
jgi:hypothetical protein